MERVNDSIAVDVFAVVYWLLLNCYCPRDGTNALRPVYDLNEVAGIGITRSSRSHRQEKIWQDLFPHLCKTVYAKPVGSCLGKQLGVYERKRENNKCSRGG